MNLSLLRSCAAFTLFLLGTCGASFAASPGGAEYGAPLDIGALSSGQHLSIAYGINNSGLVCGLSQTSNISTHAFVYTATGGFQDLGILPGGSYSEANAVNDAGQVVGDADTAIGQDHLFLWDSANGMQDLGSLAGSFSILAAGVNASGQICGNFEKGTGYFSGHAFVYSGGAFHDLGIPSGYVSSQATGINASGTICGYVADSLGNTVAFVHNGTGPLTSADLLPRPQNGVQTQANGISNAGQVVGSLTYANGNVVGFVYSGGTTQIVSAGALNGVNNIGIAVGESDGVANGFLYNIAVQATQSGPSVCAYPAALNDHNDSAGSYVSGAYNHACLDATDIGALPGGSDSLGSAINASGQVSGYARAGGAGTHVVLHDGQGLHDINALLAAAGAGTAVNPRRAYAINESGQIVGYTTRIHAFLYDAARGVQDLGALSASGTSFAYGLNDAGQVVGVSDVTADAQHAFLYAAGGRMHDLGTLPGGTYSYARAVNNASQIVGQSDRTGGQFHAFLYSAGNGMQDLGTLPGGTTSAATAVNATGQIVGYSDVGGGQTHAFLYSAGGGMQDLGTLFDGTYSVARGINAQGQVVGYADKAGGQQTAFIWDSVHGMRDLNSVMTTGTGFTLTNASALNDKGQVTGYGVNALGQTHGFVLTPTGHPHILWNNPDGRATLWQVNPDGSFGISQTYGPYTDAGGTWQAVALATGPNGVSRLLWRNPDGRATLWHVDPDGSFGSSQPYGPYTDAGGTWQAVAVSVGSDNVAHILWHHPDGRATLWQVNPDGSFGISQTYGPYTDAGGTWQAVALATGPDGVSRILWRNPDGQATLWHVYLDGTTDTSQSYGPYADGGGMWQAVAVSVGPDNVAHILWHNPDGRATLWHVDPDGSFGSSAPYGPYAGGVGLWQAVAVATGSDGVSRLLWRNPDGRATLWHVYADGSTDSSAPYGPYTDAGGTWRAVADSAGP